MSSLQQLTLHIRDGNEVFPRAESKSTFVPLNTTELHDIVRGHRPLTTPYLVN